MRDGVPGPRLEPRVQAGPGLNPASPADWNATGGLRGRHGRARRAACCLLLAAGCSRPPEAEQAVLRLDGLVRDLHRVQDDRRDHAQGYSSHVQFRLPAAAPHADLVLEGVWWTAVVTVNKHVLDPVTGGYAPVSVPVGDWLIAGDNIIAVDVHPPDDTTPSVQTGELRTFAALSGTPRLVLHGASWVEAAGIVGADAAVALVHDAPAGSTVAFRISRDGDELASLGDAPVVDGVARIAVRDVPAWALSDGESGLVWLETRLQSGDKVLDTSSFRTAARTVKATAAGVEINGVRQPLAGLRWSGGPATGDLASLTAAGLDLIELHGQPITDDVLDIADEAGVAVAILPRCDGRIRAGGGTRHPIGSADPAAWATPTLDDQDNRAIAALLRHPSALLWVLEADQSQRAARIATLSADPAARPIAGRDLPLLHSGPQAGGPGTGGGWQIEYTADVRDPEHQLALALAGNAAGGVLPGPPSQFGAWSQGVMSELGGAGIPVPGPRAGPARVDASGLKPGDVVWLSADGTERTGAVAGADGVAHASLWFTGPAELTTPGGTIAVTLQRGSTASTAASSR